MPNSIILLIKKSFNLNPYEDIGTRSDKEGETFKLKNNSAPELIIL